MVNKLGNVQGNYKKVYDSCHLNSVRCWSTARPICVSIMQHISEKNGQISSIAIFFKNSLKVSPNKINSLTIQV